MTNHTIQNLIILNLIFFIFFVFPQLYSWIRFGKDFTIYGTIKYWKRERLWLKTKSFYSWNYYRKVTKTFHNLIKQSVKLWPDNEELKNIEQSVNSYNDTEEEYDVAILTGYCKMLSVINEFTQEEVDKLKNITPSAFILIDARDLYLATEENTKNGTS